MAPSPSDGEAKSYYEKLCESQVHVSQKSEATLRFCLRLIIGPSSFVQSLRDLIGTFTFNDAVFVRGSVHILGLLKRLGIALLPQSLCLGELGAVGRSANFKSKVTLRAPKRLPLLKTFGPFLVLIFILYLFN